MGLLVHLRLKQPSRPYSAEYCSFASTLNRLVGDKLNNVQCGTVLLKTKIFNV